MAASNAPNNVKEKANQLAIQSLDQTQKVNLLAQALLREFLHRRGYKQTLSVFDKECPRNEHTISSRQLMQDLMKLSKIQERSKRLAEWSASTRKGKSTGAVPQQTFMEMLCGYRVRKQRIRTMQRNGNRELPSTDVVIGTMSDSSDEEEVLKESVDKHIHRVEEVKRTVQEQMAELQAKKDALSAELERLRAREEKLIKKNKKLSATSGTSTTGKKEKKIGKQKINSDEDFSPQRSRVRHGLDPLESAMERLVNMPTTSNGHSNGPAVGRNWTPGSSSVNIPAVGLSGGNNAAPPLDRPPSFVAGMHLMSDRIAKEAPVWEAPTQARRSSSGTSVADEEDDDFPSPYRVMGKTPYDHHATRPGILRSDTGSGSHTPRDGGSASHTPRDGSSPTHPGAGIGFHTVSPTGTHPNATAAHQRTQRRVTIIADP